MVGIASLGRRSRVRHWGLLGMLAAAIWLGGWAARIQASSDPSERPAGEPWSQVLTYEPMREPVSWCGPDAVVAQAVRGGDEIEGIVRLDVATKALTWVIKDPLVQSGPFCSHDGQIVFFNRFRPSRPDEPDELGHGIQPIGLWAHDRKSGTTWKVSESFRYSGFPRPASPASRAYVLVPIEGRLPSLTLPPGWRILRLPRDRREVVTGRWAQDGSYIVLAVKAPGSRLFQAPVSYQVYSPAGDLIREVSREVLAQLPQHREVKAAREGVYVVGKDGWFRRLDPWSGVIEQVPVRVEVSAFTLFTFGVSPDGRIAYSLLFHRKNEPDIGLRVAEPSGSVVQVDPSGSHPEFSPNGEYLAVTQWRPALGNAKLIVYRTAAPRR